MLNLDWTSFNATQLPVPPDVIIAAGDFLTQIYRSELRAHSCALPDVVYDCSILGALCDVLRSCLHSSRNSRAYVASTLRDPLTLSAFRNKIGEKMLRSVQEVYPMERCSEASDMRVNDEMRYQYGTFTFLDGSKCEAASIFPHSSTLEAPTLIFEIVAKDL